MIGFEVSARKLLMNKSGAAAARTAPDVCLELEKGVVFVDGPYVILLSMPDYCKYKQKTCLLKR